MTLQFTKQQLAGVNYKGNAVVIKAGAGTGKTSLLVGYANANSDIRMLYLCYNKAIQLEAEKKFPKNVVCRTGHSIAYAMCGKPLQKKLTGNLRLTDIKRFINTPSWELTQDVSQIFNNFLSSSSPGIDDTHAQFMPYMTERQKNRKDHALKGARSIWKAAKNPNVDFPATHDVYLKMYCMQPGEMDKWFGAILFDEAQDANPVISDFVYKQNCKHIVVGDDHQQLYRWRNANNSMEAFRKARNADVLVINKSFRFGQSVADLATRLLNFKSQKVGCPPFPVEGNEAINDLVATQFKPSLLKQCHTRLHRTVSGTLKTALRFIDKRIYWVGGIDNYNLQEVLDVYFLQSGETSKIQRKKLITEYRDFEEYKNAAEGGSDPEMNRIVRLIDEHGSHLIGQVNKLRKNAVRDEKYADVVISTAHRSKGLEWDTVIVEEDFIDFLDPKYEMEDDEIADELNLLYVASTRAMKNLQPNQLILSIMRLTNGDDLPDCITVMDNGTEYERPQQNAAPEVKRISGERNPNPQRITLGN